MDFYSFLSWGHIGCSIVGLLTAAVVLAAPKGTLFHRKAGYIFVAAMLGVNISAAFIFNLTGRVNLLHGFIVLSLFSLLYGMEAAWRRRSSSWLRRHIRGMNGAALGVWAAGFAEVTVRVLPHFLPPAGIQWVALGIGAVAFFVIGYLNHYFTKSTADSTTSSYF